MYDSRRRKMTREDIYDHIVGSGASGYSWYVQVYDYRPPDDPDDDWYIIFLMEDPDDNDETLEVRLDTETILEYAENITNEQNVNTDTTLVYGVTLQTKHQCELLVSGSDDVDFDADMADQLIQAIAYGEVVFC
jgi:hypothetical protein